MFPNRNLCGCDFFLLNSLKGTPSWAVNVECLLSGARCFFYCSIRWATCVEADKSWHFGGWCTTLKHWTYECSTSRRGTAFYSGHSVRDLRLSKAYEDVILCESVGLDWVCRCNITSLVVRWNFILAS